MNVSGESEEKTLGKVLFQLLPISMFRSHCSSRRFIVLLAFLSVGFVICHYVASLVISTEVRHDVTRSDVTHASRNFELRARGARPLL